MLDGVLVCTPFFLVMEIYIVYIIITARVLVANGIKCVLFCETVVCGFSAPLWYAYRILLYKIWLRRF